MIGWSKVYVNNLHFYKAIVSYLLPVMDAAETLGSGSRLVTDNGITPKKRKITYRNDHELNSAVTTAYIDEVFTNLKAYCSSLVNKTQAENEPNEFHKTIKGVGEAKSLDALLNACTDLELVLDNNALLQGIKCKACFTPYESVGMFKFTSANDIHELGKSNQLVLSSKFKGLRRVIRHHLMSKNHGKSARRSNPNFESSIATVSYVENKVGEIKQFLEELLPNSSPNPIAPKRKAQSNLSLSTSISDILDSCSHLQLLLGPVPTDDVNHFTELACMPCRNAILKKHPESKSKVGLFKYDRTVGITFGGPKKNEPLQPLVFRQLKDTLSSHISTKFHCTSVGDVYVPSEKEIRVIKKNESTGMILGKLAYKAIVRYQSKISFEEEVAFLADIGVDVGDINHSVDYVDKLFPHLYSVLHERTMTVLHQPVATYLQASPFVVFADKITPYGTTMQIIGIIIFKDGKNMPITLDILPVKHEIQNGAALAKDIVDTLFKFYTPESAKRLYVGSSFDGQYITLKVPQEIMRLLGFEIDTSTPLQDLNQQLFHSYSWDPAHILELACGDVKKSKLHEWIDKVETTIVTVNQGKTYGKQYLRLMEEAQQMDVVLMRPGSFSETRFSTYKHRVLNRFLNNYPVLYKTHAQDKDSDLNLFNNCEFCVRLSGLVDIFDVVGATSRQIQSSELLPWECDSIMEDGIRKLLDMAESCHLIPSVDHWKKLSQAVQEISAHGTFQGMAVLIKQSTFYVTRSNSIIMTRDSSFSVVIQRVMTELKFYLRSLAASIQTRYMKHHTQKTLVAARDSFSRSLILTRSSNEVHESFIDYCNLAFKWGFLDASISQSDLNNEYKMFCSKVKKGYNDRITKFGVPVPESSQYWEIMTSDEESERFSRVLNLLLTSMVRNKSECIAECVGSMMKQHLNKRCMLSDKNLGMEIFLHFNGPRANRDCNGLVRKANENLFGKDKLHFYRSSHSSDLKFWDDGSKVISKIHSRSGRIDIADDGGRVEEI